MPLPPARPSPHLAIVGTLGLAMVAFGLLAFGLARGTSIETRPAEGVFWQAVDGGGHVLELSTGEPLHLAAGDRLRIRDSRISGYAYVAFELSARRAGAQSGAVHVRGGGWQLDLLLADPVQLFLTEAAGDEESPGRLLGRAEASRAGAAAGDPFALALHAAGETLQVSLDGRDALAVDLGHAARFTDAVVWADGLDVSALSTTAANAKHKVDLSDDVLSGTDAPPLRLGLGRGAFGAVVAAALLLLACGYVRAVAGAGRRATTLLRAAALLVAPAAAAVAACAVLRSPPQVAGGVILAAGAIGLLLAGRVLRADAATRSEIAHPLDALLVLALVVASCILLGRLGARWRDASTRQAEAVASQLDPRPYEAAPTTLDGGTQLEVPGVLGDFDLDARVALAPGTIVELRLREMRHWLADGLALCLSSRSDFPSGFRHEDPQTFEPVGSRAPALADEQAHELHVEVRGENFSARLDGRPLVEARSTGHPLGGVRLLAAAGRVSLAALTISPRAARTAIGGALNLARTQAGLAPALAWLLLLALAAGVLRQAIARAAAPLAFALVPLAVAALVAPVPPAPLDATAAPPWPLDPAAAVFAAAAAALLLVAHPLLTARAAGAMRALLFAVPASVVCGLLASLLAGREPAPPSTDYRLDAFAGDRLDAGLVSFEHPVLRRNNGWLVDHRFRDREFPLVKPDGALRVMCLGSSSTWGYAIPDASGLDWPAQLQTRLRAALPGRPVEVINAAVQGSGAARLLPFLRESLLPFSPDVLVLSLFVNDSWYLSQFDEGAFLDRAATPGFTHDADEIEREDAQIERGKLALKRLLHGFADGRDAREVWREIEPDPAVPDPPRRFETLLRACAETCQQHGIDLVLVKEPVSGDPPRLWKDEFYAAIDEVAREFGLRVVDPRPALAAAGGAALFVDDVHPTPAGDAVMAQAVEPAVEAAARGRDGR